jgi:hypothetical protein
MSYTINFKNSLEQSSEEYVFCRYIRKNGKIIYPKNSKFFRFPNPKNK